MATSFSVPSNVSREFSDRIPDQRATGVPKFKSIPPLSLPISPPSMLSPSSYFNIPPGLTLTELLDSPVLLSNSNILPSPTTGSFPTSVNAYKSSLSSLITATEESANQLNQQQNTSLHMKKSSDDGYNWRKYGQKQVKGSENPRSYYKCSFPNCQTKKKVEIAWDGQVMEIIYKGSHNHAKPHPTIRSSSTSSVASSQTCHFLANTCNSRLSPSQDNSSISIMNREFDQRSLNKSRGGDFDEEETEAKRWKWEIESEGLSKPVIRGAKETSVVQTTSHTDLLDDGYRWRKYGQKLVKGNPNPRSYYKCTSSGCSVRKHVERASHDMRKVITSYQGKHNHDVPVPCGDAH